MSCTRLRRCLCDVKVLTLVAVFTDLAHHAVPHVVDFLAVFAVSHQVKVVRELYIPGDLL